MVLLKILEVAWIIWGSFWGIVGLIAMPDIVRVFKEKWKNRDNGKGLGS